ncbi:MAG: hypothetical protein MHM6MM_001657 [Cercozoa sp. M6MM]
MDEALDVIFPKKTPMVVANCSGHVEILCAEDRTIWFIKDRNSEWAPALRTLHRFPELLPRFQVDQGAIRFLLNGSDVKCPGLTSPGAEMPEDDEVEVGDIVAVYAEGKEHALAVGVLVKSIANIKSENRGDAIRILNFLGPKDGLWAQGLKLD